MLQVYAELYAASVVLAVTQHGACVHLSSHQHHHAE